MDRLFVYTVTRVDYSDTKNVIDYYDLSETSNNGGRQLSITRPTTISRLEALVKLLENELNAAKREMSELDNDLQNAGVAVS